MSKNQDGLEPGQMVDTETMQRIERERSKKAKAPTESKSTPKRSTKTNEG